MIDMHVHSTESDGRNSLDDILQLCIKDNLTKLGIADHWKTKRYSPDFYVKDINTYIAHCNELKKSAAEHGISVFTGSEVDFTQKYGFDISDEDIKQFNKLDFILFEYVNTENETWGTINGKPIELLFSLRDSLTVPVGLAHNNFFYNFKYNYKDIIKTMKEKNIFLELCEGEELGKKKVDATSLKKLLSLKKNMADLAVYKGETKITRKKHTQDGKFYFEYFPDDMWQYIRDCHLPLSISTDNHSGTGLGKHPRIDFYLEKYQLTDHLILNTGAEYEVNMPR